MTISFTDHSPNNYRHLEDMVYRLQLTYDEIVDLLDFKYIPTSTKEDTLLPGIYQVTDINFILKSFLPKEVKVNITIDDVRLKTNLSTNKTIRFTKKSFFYVILGFTHSHSGELGDILDFIQLIPGSYKSGRPINITGIEKVRLKCDYINGSIVNGVRESILFCFPLSSPPGRKTYKEPRIKLFKKANNSILSHITFYFEDNDYKPVIFNGEAISFTCQLTEKD